MQLTGTIRPALGAHLRVAPQGQVITGLSRDTELEIDGPPITVDGYQWLRVRVKRTGRCGFVGAEFVEVKPLRPDVPHPHPRPAPEPRPAPRPSEPRPRSTPDPTRPSDGWILVGGIIALALLGWALSSLL